MIEEIKGIASPNIQIVDDDFLYDPEKWDFMHLVVSPVRLSLFGFYLEYYLLIMDLFRLAQKKGIYKFLRLNDYKHIFRKLLFQEGLFKK